MLASARGSGLRSGGAGMSVRLCRADRGSQGALGDHRPDKALAGNGEGGAWDCGLRHARDRPPTRQTLKTLGLPGALGATRPQGVAAWRRADPTPRAVWTHISDKGREDFGGAPAQQDLALRNLSSHR